MPFRKIPFRTPQHMFHHPVLVASIVLYGDPRPDEPIGLAWERTRDRLGLRGEPDWMVLDRLRARVIQGLPGVDESEKIASVLVDAPDWLARALWTGALVSDSSEWGDVREGGMREDDVREADVREADMREADMREADVREDLGKTRASLGTRRRKSDMLVTRQVKSATR